MKIVTENVSAKIINHQLAYQVAKQAFIEATQTGIIFPVVAGHSPNKKNNFAIKSATTNSQTGWKTGSYWPDNIKKDITCHSSTIFLLDQTTGRLSSIVEASKANAYRTAAADAVAADYLARADASCLTIFGTGHQAAYECRALVNVRPIEKVLVVGRSPTKAAKFTEDLLKDGINATVCDAKKACQQADIIVTATTSTEPLFEYNWIQPGTHIASMGSDRIGKQELPLGLLYETTLFCDLTSQSIVIGEFQHIADAVQQGKKSITMLGDVILNQHSGRTSDKEITVFDSSGISLQDLILGDMLMKQAEQNGELIQV